MRAVDVIFSSTPLPSLMVGRKRSARNRAVAAQRASLLRSGNYNGTLGPYGVDASLSSDVDDANVMSVMRPTSSPPTYSPTFAPRSSSSSRSSPTTSTTSPNASPLFPSAQRARLSRGALSASAMYERDANERADAANLVARMLDELKHVEYAEVRLGHGGGTEVVVRAERGGDVVYSVNSASKFNVFKSALPFAWFRPSLRLSWTTSSTTLSLQLQVLVRDWRVRAAHPARTV